MRNHKPIIILSLVSACFLSSCNGSPFSESDFVNKLFPNGPWDLIIQLGAFLVLIAIVFFLGYKPIKKMLTTRKEYVQKQLDDAEAAKKTVADAALVANQEIEKGKEEALSIINEAKIQADKEATSIIAKAKEEASLRRIKADEEIRQAQEASKQQMRDEIIDVALQASSQVLKRNVDDKDNQRLVDELLDSLNGGK